MPSAVKIGWNRAICPLNMDNTMTEFRSGLIFSMVLWIDSDRGMIRPSTKFVISLKHTCRIASKQSKLQTRATNLLIKAIILLILPKATINSNASMHENDKIIKC